MVLYPYQQRVKALLQAGHSVILQAPTGAGKTRAALAPYIDSFYHAEPDQFPRKCLYSVPMRVLANQFHQEHQYLSLPDRQQRMEVSIQTGDRPEDPKLESNLIFTTIDQTLSSFLNIPYGLGKGSANLNAGAVISSYLVFDELHLYDPNTSLPTTLHMLSMLKDLTPFIVMTATFSSEMLTRLGALLNAVVVPEDEQARQEMQLIGSQVGKERRFYPVDAPLTAGQVLDPENFGLRTICICNTVRRAQDLYEEINQALAKSGYQETQVCLLHSRFYKEDRDRKETWIKEQFGIPQDEYSGPRLILIATQVIEVGLDVTCDVMHTELAPGSSILQRAGRCARRANEHGHVFIYLPRDSDGEPDYTPYYLKNDPRNTARGFSLCQNTWEALNSPGHQGQIFNFEREQAFINTVHRSVDESILQGIQDTRFDHTKKIFTAIEKQELSLAPDLIRDIDSRYIIIHPAPASDENLVRNPWYYDGFAMSPYSLAGAFPGLNQDQEIDTPWIMQAAKDLSKANESQDGHQVAGYRWYHLVEAKEVFSAPVFAIHPNCAHYDDQIGLVLRRSTNQPVLHRNKKQKDQKIFRYQRETLAEHVAKLYRSYRQGGQDPESSRQFLPLQAEIASFLRRAEGYFHLPPGQIEQMLRGVLACHDTGKLQREWQAWVHQWQRKLDEIYPGQGYLLPEDYMAAHTDSDGSDEQKGLQRKLGKRPPHAAEGAIAAIPVLETLSGESETLFRAAITAIVRHHGAGVDSYQAYRLHPAGRRALAIALKQVDLDAGLARQARWKDEGRLPLRKYMARFSDIDLPELFFYFLFVRVLRLADQHALISPL